MTTLSPGVLLSVYLMISIRLQRAVSRVAGVGHRGDESGLAQLLSAAVSHDHVGRVPVQGVFPTRIVGGAKLRDHAGEGGGVAILSVEAEQVAIAGEVHAGFVRAGAGADGETDRIILERAQSGAGVGKIGGGLFHRVAGTMQHLGRDEFIGERGEVLPGFGERFAAALGGIDDGRIFVIVIIAPQGEGEAQLFEIIEARGSLRLGLGLRQRG